jgi:hypothetical protein
MRPNLTPDQEEKARLIILGKIEAQLDYKKDVATAPAKENTRGNTRGNTTDGLTDAQINAKNKGAEIKRIMMSGKNIKQQLEDASGGEYYFKYEKGGWSVYDEEPDELGLAVPKYSGLNSSAEMYKIFSTKEQEQYYKQGTKQFN